MIASRHNEYLDRLVYKLGSINENLDNVEWMLKDGIWMHDHSHARLSMCDLILFYYNNNAVPIELKGQKNKRQKAYDQIIHGKEFAESRGYNVNYGKFVVYSPKDYYWESLRFNNDNR